MKNLIMMLAIVGVVSPTFAQELSNEFKQHSIAASNTVVKQDDVDHYSSLTSIGKKNNGIDVSYPYVKEVLRNRYGKIGDDKDLEQFIYANPSMVNYVKTSESYLYSFGLSKREVMYLKEYVSSSKK